MKYLGIYCIVDVMAENILNVFSAINDEMAKRQFDQALESNKDKIFDSNDIVLMCPRRGSLNLTDFWYCVPETYEEVKEFFISYEELQVIGSDLTKDGKKLMTPKAILTSSKEGDLND